MMSQMIDQERLADLYLNIKNTIIRHGFGDEIDWQEDNHIEKLNETTFLKESAWVVLSSGMRETVIRQKFPSISKAFYNWHSSKIVNNKNKCRKAALKVFGNKRKIDAIIKIVEKTYKLGFYLFKENIVKDGIEFIQLLPFMGPATSYHLAKNIGLDVVKPDRHLLRITDKAGYNCPEKLCNTISKYVGDKISVVDIVMWRFATIQSNYLESFALN